MASKALKASIASCLQQHANRSPASITLSPEPVALPRLEVQRTRYRLTKVSIAKRKILINLYKNGTSR